MKLETQHLFYILLGVLLLSHLGFGVKEYFENKDNDEKTYDDTGLPKGIPRSQIPNGDEDLYIKKTEIVPPVCPKCPDVTSCPKPAKCPPCPPCGRCPEPMFDCKKVPNYNRSDSSLPRPVLTDFSQFGM
jgi:hypothetical protein